MKRLLIDGKPIRAILVTYALLTEIEKLPSRTKGLHTMNEKWEYITTFVEAKVSSKDIRNFIKDTFDKKPRKHSPEAMIPDLNKLGQEGWELITMEPVADVGGKEDILIAGEGRKWTALYFCVFKRRLPDTAMPVVAVVDPEQQRKQQEQYAAYYRQQQAQAQAQAQAQQRQQAQQPTPPQSNS